MKSTDYKMCYKKQKQNPVDDGSLLQIQNESCNQHYHRPSKQAGLEQALH